MKKLYSIPQEQWIVPQAVSAAICNKRQSPKEFYDFCVHTFPLVAGKVTATEKHGLRSMTHLEKVGATQSYRANNYDLMKITNVNTVSLPDFQKPCLVACSLPRENKFVPLLPRLLKLGEMLYGAEDFLFNTLDVLQRDAAPRGRVVGDDIHNDEFIKFGISVRCMSVLSITAEAGLGDQKKANKELWWTTQCVDMRTLPYEDMEKWESVHRDAFSDAADQQEFSQKYQLHPLPANRHIIMPTWMFHKSGGSGDNIPAEYTDGSRPMPKAYIAHAILYEPHG